MSHCCKNFAEQAGQLLPPVGGGALYPASARPVAQFERLKDGTWGINGCCGGGCFVVTEMRFCPYCGANVEEKP